MKSRGKEIQLCVITTTTDAGAAPRVAAIPRIMIMVSAMAADATMIALAVASVTSHLHRPHVSISVF